MRVLILLLLTSCFQQHATCPQAGQSAREYLDVAHAAMDEMGYELGEVVLVADPALLHTAAKVKGNVVTYNPNLFTAMSLALDQSFAVGLLGHELAHIAIHKYGLVKQGAHPHEHEAMADDLAGCVLAKAGCTTFGFGVFLELTKGGVQHPPGRVRVKRLEVGYAECKRELALDG